MSEIWNLSTLCRCCHADGYFKSLSLSYQGENDVEIYEIMLRETLRISISAPPLETSYTICDECIVKLRDATNFKNQVLMCEQKFKVYCRNEQFVNTQNIIKLEVDGDNNCDDKNDSDHGDSFHDDEDEHTDGNVTVDIKEEYNFEVDIEHPIEAVKHSVEEVKNEDNGDVKTDDSKKNIKKGKTRVNVTSEIKPLEIDTSLIMQVKTETGKNYACKTCGGSYQTKKQISHHIHREHTAPLKCEYCSKLFTLPTSFRNHLKLHTGKQFQCKFCDKIFGNQTTFEQHVNSHTGEVQYKCDVCQKDFKYRQSLRKHLKWHLGGNKVSLCDLCGNSFNDQSNLQIHIKTVHEKQRPFTCTLCGKAYTAKKHLKYHLQSHLGVKNYKCDVCDRRYACPKTMKIHRLTHDNKFKCKYCSKIFDEQKLWSLHVKTNHREALTCQICGKKLMSKYSLNRHMDDHKGIKRFSCDICCIKFSQKSMLKRHNLRKHNPEPKTDEKTKCDLCNKMYRNIKAHMDAHYNRRFACDICGKTYPENNTLTRHKLQKHFGRTYDCEVCGKKYIQNAKLTTHKLKVHKIKKEIQEVSENSLQSV